MYIAGTVLLLTYDFVIEALKLVINTGEKNKNEKIHILQEQKTNMNVVNVKVAHIRPKYKNLKEWMEDPNNIYIGRRGIVFIDGARFPPNDSKWHNPFKINSTDDRQSVISKYRNYINKKGYNFDELKGKTLGCWCKPEGKTYVIISSIIIGVILLYELSTATRYRHPSITHMCSPLPISISCQMSNFLPVNS